MMKRDGKTLVWDSHTKMTTMMNLISESYNDLVDSQYFNILFILFVDKSSD